MTIQRNNFFVITGEPGAGKTTLLEKLLERGVTCAGEAGGRIIEVQVKIGGRGLPWIDPPLFAELMFHEDVSNYLTADPETLTVFDRGVVDTAGYPELMGFAVPEYFRFAAAE